MNLEMPEIGSRWRRKLDLKPLVVTQVRPSRFGMGSLRFKFDAHPSFEPEYWLKDFLELYEPVMLERRPAAGPVRFGEAALDPDERAACLEAGRS